MTKGFRNVFLVGAVASAALLGWGCRGQGESGTQDQGQAGQQGTGGAGGGADSSGQVQGSGQQGSGEAGSTDVQGRGGAGSDVGTQGQDPSDYPESEADKRR
jgi:hypothetical protein